MSNPPESDLPFPPEPPAAPPLAAAITPDLRPPEIPDALRLKCIAIERNVRKKYGANPMSSDNIVDELLLYAEQEEARKAEPKIAWLRKLERRLLKLRRAKP